MSFVVSLPITFRTAALLLLSTLCVCARVHACVRACVRVVAGVIDLNIDSERRLQWIFMDITTANRVCD